MMNEMDQNESLDAFVEELEQVKPTEEKHVSDTDIEDSFIEIAPGIHKAKDGWVKKSEVTCSIRGCTESASKGSPECTAHALMRKQLYDLKSGVLVKMHRQVPESPAWLKRASKEGYRSSTHYMLTKDLLRVLQGGMCPLCNQQLDGSTSLHHEWYMYDSGTIPIFGRENPNHISIVHQRCHEMEHGLSETDQSDRSIMVAGIGVNLATLKEINNEFPG